MEKEVIMQKELTRFLGHVFVYRKTPKNSQLSTISLKNLVNCPSRAVLSPNSLNSSLLPLAENDKLKGLPYCMKDVNR